MIEASSLLGQRHGRRADRADAVLRLITRHGRERRLRALAQVMPRAAVEVDVDQSGDGIQAAHIARIRRGLRAAMRSPESVSPPVRNVPSGW